MFYSLTKAAKQTGLGEFTILRAIEDGRISGTQDLFGEWHVDEEDLRTFELATAEPVPHQDIEDVKSQIAVTETEQAQNAQELVPALIGASRPSLTSAKHTSSKASLQPQESRRIFIRLAKSEAGIHSGSSWDNEIRLDDRDKISESVPNSCRWQIQSFPIRGLLLFALGWVGGLSTYHFFDRSRGSQDRVKVSDKTLVSKNRTISPTDLARGSGAENSRRFAATSKSNGFDHPRPQLRSQRQAQQRRSSNAVPAEDPAITQSSITKEQDSGTTPLVPFPETRPTTISGWTLRGVVDGRAVLAGPYGTLKVAQGDMVPGLGTVDSIVLWGNRWIVATSRGLVTTP
jgi:hypothetical protein